MKKNLFYLFALICSVGLFTACSDDDETEPHAWVGTYGMTDYSTTGDKNEPAAGALYADWAYSETNNVPLRFSSFFRYMGGAVLPQVLNAVILDKDGNIRADYMAAPTITFAAPAVTDVMNIMMGTYVYSTAGEIKSLFPTSGFTTSPKDFAYWSDNNGKFLVKLNIGAIMGAAIGEGSAEIGQLIEQLLSTSDPAMIKRLLGTVLGADISGISDATITQLLGWINNGVPMNYETTEEGNTRIYLDKTAFNSLFASHDGTYDVKILWDALAAGGLIPSEAQAAGTLLTTIGSNWSKTVTFNLGLDLKKR